MDIKDIKTFIPRDGQVLVVRIDVSNRPPAVAAKLLSDYRDQLQRYFVGINIKILVVPQTFEFALLEEKDMFFDIMRA